MNQSPKKNKYIIKTQKLCSIPFLAIQPSSNTHPAHSKLLCSQQRCHCTYSWNLHWQELFQSTATSHRTYFRCQIFIPRQGRSTWKPITCVPLMGFYSRAIQPCAFQEVSAKHTRGPSQSLALGRGASSMKGVHVTHGSGSKFLYQCLLDVYLKLRCLARPAVLWHQPHKSIIQLLPLPFEIFPGRGQRARRLSQNTDGIG